MRLTTINCNRLLRQIVRHIKVNKTTYYAVGASIGVVATGLTCAKAAVKSKEYLDEYGDATPKEKVIFVGGLWIMPVVVGGATIFCIWRGHKIHLEKEASLAAMSAYWKNRYDELDKKVTEKLGEEANREIKEEIFQEKMADKQVPATTLPAGMFWVYDEYSQQFLKVSAQQLTWAAYAMNKRFGEMKDVEYNWVLKLLGGKYSKHMNNQGWSWGNDDLIDAMSYNGTGMWINMGADYYVDDGRNKTKDGVPVAHLWFDWCPEPMYVKD